MITINCPRPIRLPELDLIRRVADSVPNFTASFERNEIMDSLVWVLKFDFDIKDPNYAHMVEQINEERDHYRKVFKIESVIEKKP